MQPLQRPSTGIWSAFAHRRSNACHSQCGFGFLTGIFLHFRHRLHFRRWCRPSPSYRKAWLGCSTSIPEQQHGFHHLLAPIPGTFRHFCHLTPWLGIALLTYIRAPARVGAASLIAASPPSDGSDRNDGFFLKLSCISARLLELHGYIHPKNLVILNNNSQIWRNKLLTITFNCDPWRAPGAC